MYIFLAADEARCRSELDAAKASSKSSEAQREGLARARREAGEAKAALGKTVAAHESALERHLAERHDELTRCQMQEIRLPRKQAAAGGAGAGAGAGGKKRGKKAAGKGAGSKRRRGGGDDEDDEDGDDAEDEGASDVAMTDVSGSGVFSQDVTATSSEDSEGVLRGAVTSGDARRAERIDYDELEEDTDVSKWGRRWMLLLVLLAAGLSTLLVLFTVHSSLSLNPQSP